MDRQETAALIERARAGSSGALDALYARCAGKLLPLIRLRMGSSLRSELESRDILQAVLLKSFQRIGQFEGRATGSLMAWMARIAENEIRDRADYQGRQRRDAARRVPLDEAEELPQPLRSALSQVIVTEETEHLERALESLVDSRPDLAEPLRPLIDQYLLLSRRLETGVVRSDLATSADPLPTFEGFRTIERLGAGGMGQVFKLQDLKLDRIVAAKVVR